MNAMTKPASDKPLPKRRYKDHVELSVIGCGGIVLMGMPQRDANQAVAGMVERGVNYFDVAPSTATVRRKRSSDRRSHHTGRTFSLHARRWKGMRLERKRNSSDP